MPDPTRPSFTDEEALAFHRQGKPGKLEITPTKLRVPTPPSGRTKPSKLAGWGTGVVGT